MSSKEMITEKIQQQSKTILDEWPAYSANHTDYDVKNFNFNFLGARERKYFCNFQDQTLYKEFLMHGIAPVPENQVASIPINPQKPALTEEYFEHLDLLESVCHHHKKCLQGKNPKREFRMMELGAGYGRWSMDAVCALRRLHAADELKQEPLYHLVLIEAEPSHVQMIHQNIQDNHCSAAQINVVNAAVSGHNGTVEFWIGNPAGWYGQAISDTAIAGKTAQVTCVSLESLLNARPEWDLLDFDIQGTEVTAIASCFPQINDKVRKMHVGTHSVVIEQQLRALFQAFRWIPIWDYSLQGERDTLYGKTMFGDGIQSWMNPKFV